MAKKLADFQEEAKTAGHEITGDETIAELKVLLADDSSDDNFDMNPGADSDDEEQPGDDLDTTDPEEQLQVLPGKPKLKTCAGLFASFPDNRDNFPNGGDYSVAYYESKGMDVPGETTAADAE